MAITQLSDESLYAAYRNGDKAAFDEMYARYRQPLFLFLLRRGHQQAAAEDIFHDGWMRVIDQGDRFDGSHFRAWIYSVMRNLSTDYFRKATVRSAEQIDESSIDQHHLSVQQQQEDLDCIQLMKHSVAALPLEQRDVFLLKEEAGLSLQQIAEIMAVGKETIKSRIRYAMKQLKKILVDCL